jgi:hypothetical protein
MWRVAIYREEPESAARNDTLNYFPVSALVVSMFVIGHLPKTIVNSNIDRIKIRYTDQAFVEKMERSAVSIIKDIDALIKKEVAGE